MLEKEWYQNGQLKRESYFYDIDSKANKGELSKESKSYYENGQIKSESRDFKNMMANNHQKFWYENGQLSYDKENNSHFNEDGNEIDAEEWRKIRRKVMWNED